MQTFIIIFIVHIYSQKEYELINNIINHQTIQIKIKVQTLESESVFLNSLKVFRNYYLSFLNDQRNTITRINNNIIQFTDNLIKKEEIEDKLDILYNFLQIQIINVESHFIKPLTDYYDGLTSTQKVTAYDEYFTVKNRASTILYSELSYLFDEHENLLIKNPKTKIIRKPWLDFKFFRTNLKKNLGVKDI